MLDQSNIPPIVPAKKVSLEMNLDAVDARIAADPTIIQLLKEREGFFVKQREKQEGYKKKIEEERKKITIKRQEMNLIKQAIAGHEAQIRKFRVFGRYRPTGLRRIDQRIGIRKRAIRMKEMRKAVAQARREVCKRIRL